MRILIINSGSSTIKLALYQIGLEEHLAFSGKIDRIGVPDGHFEMRDAEGRVFIRRELNLPDQEAALKVFLEWLRDEKEGQELDGIGHRLVHGGAQYIRPHIVTPEILASLKKLIPLAPNHLPQELRILEAIQESFPSLTQVACFDTAFHRQMPLLAQVYALPHDVQDQRLLRYGFHGLSCEYLITELRNLAGPEAADGRVIVAHLGNGASMTAVRQGKSVDTTMGFTPAGGLVMSSRSGDLDPGVLVYLLTHEGISPSGLNEIVNRKSGLLGLSGISSDMQDLLRLEKKDSRAWVAVNLFCYQAKKFLAALAAAMGGLDTLIFTAGIGENSPVVRWRICAGLEFLGIHLDANRNDAQEPVISGEGSPCVVRVMPTNEALIIARHTRNLIHGKSGREL